jgi:two-component system NtrC family sensor kinase
VELLPPAWQYPEITSGRITLDKKTYLSTGFKNGKDILSSNILINGDNRGIVELIYATKMPELDEGPFLQEERNLIDAVAKQIAIIVERKQTEEDKARLQEQLRHADRLATIGQLSAGVAHELNEPIGGILGFAQLIAKYPKLPEQIKQDIEKITKASLHAREVVKKLMIFARQMPPQKTHVNLNQVVEEGLYFLESRCAKEGIEVLRHLSPCLPEIIADPSQITQVLVNIVVNAIQAMPDGGTLKIKTEVSGKNVKLTIEDTGIGMDEKVKQKIFLPFFTTKDIGEGTGIGMAVVHGIITAHGGSIEVESEPGCGTKVEVKLPEAKM